MASVLCCCQRHGGEDSLRSQTTVDVFGPQQKAWSAFPEAGDHDDTTDQLATPEAEENPPPPPPTGFATEFDMVVEKQGPVRLGPCGRVEQREPWQMREGR
mmetsp:Transcript_32944/g.96143  ORF Transcript_32944/g.96143 Transcript_32944/m.96143 type:complete len:101 (-) Transcript_32944:202-504(-)